jgi:hypothetical protein
MRLNAMIFVPDTIAFSVLLNSEPTGVQTPVGLKAESFLSIFEHHACTEEPKSSPNSAMLGIP